MSASVIIPTHNRCTQLRRCLAAVSSQEYAALEIIVVDDGSFDGTDDMVAKEFPTVRYIFQANRGPAAARNAGMRIATGEILAFTDDDCVPPRDWLQRHVSYYADPSVGAVGGPQIPRTLNFYDKIDMARGMTNDGDAFRRITHVSGWEGLASSNLSIRRQALQRAGLFDEAFLTGADPELTRRIVRLGRYVLIYDPGLRVEHLKRHTFASYARMRFHRGCGSALTDIKEGSLQVRRFIPVFNVVRGWRDWRNFRQLFGGGPAQFARVWGFFIIMRWIEVAGRAYYYWRVGRTYRSSEESSAYGRSGDPA